MITFKPSLNLLSYGHLDNSSTKKGKVGCSGKLAVVKTGCERMRILLWRCE